jgi:hypothetical protein
MHAFYKGLAIGIFGMAGALSASAQTSDSSTSDQVYQGAVAAAHGNAGSSEAIGQSTSMPPPASTAALPDVDAGAVAAAHATGTEALGQSTSAPAMTSQLTREEVYRGAVEAAHGGGGSSEAIGQSTGMAGITAGTPH